MKRIVTVCQFERQFENTISSYDFKPGDLVLVRNSASESDLSCKTKPRYLGPMVVIRHSHTGSYRLAELDGAVSKLHYAAFRLVPYLARSHASIPITRLLDRDNLITVVEEEAAPPDDPDDV